MLHSIKKTFKAHKVSPAEKITDNDFDNVYSVYSNLRKEVNAVRTAAKSVGASWQKLGSSSVAYIGAYESNFVATPSAGAKKSSKKSKVNSKSSVPLDEDGIPKLVVSPGVESQSLPLGSNTIPASTAVAVPANSLNDEEQHILLHQPARLVERWNAHGQEIVSKTSKLPTAVVDIKGFMKMLDKVDAQIAKRNKLVADLNYYLAKQRDLENDKKKSVDDPKQKMRIYQAQAHVRAHEEIYAETGRVCLVNMKKCIILRKDLILRATSAFLAAQVAILESHPFKTMQDNFVSRHPETDTHQSWHPIDFTLEVLPGAKGASTTHTDTLTVEPNANSIPIVAETQQNTQASKPSPPPQEQAQTDYPPPAPPAPGFVYPDTDVNIDVID
eukprot:Awhi_evm2s10908